MNTTCQSLGTLSCIIDMHAPSYYSLFYNGNCIMYHCRSSGIVLAKATMKIDIILCRYQKKAVTMVKAPDFENVLSAGSSDPLGAPTVTQLNPAAHLG